MVYFSAGGSKKMDCQYCGDGFLLSQRAAIQRTSRPHTADNNEMTRRDNNMPDLARARPGRARRTVVICALSALIALAAGAGPLRAQPNIATLAERNSLADEWRITASDRPEYSSRAYDDSGWDTIRMPGSFFGYALRKTGALYGTVWLRKTIIIDARAERLPAVGLILGRIANADETYFNGERIGGMGRFLPEDNSMWNHPRHYLVPGKLVNYGGKNVIAIRVSHYIFGEMIGTLALTDLDTWEQDRVWQNFTRVTAGYIIIAMGCLFLVIFLLFYALRREQEYLYYALQMACGFFIVLELCNFWNTFGSNLMRLKALGLSWAAVNVVHPIFLHRIYDLQRKKIEWALWVFLALTIGLLLTITGKPSDLLQVNIFITFTICIGLYNISCHVSAIFKRRPYSRVFGFFGIAVALGAIHDGLVYLAKFTDYSISLFGYVFRDYMIFHYMAIMLYTGTALVLVFRFISMATEVEDLKTTLENFIIENAILNKQVVRSRDEGKKRPEESALTDRTMEKLQKVVAFINENYQSSLSREGLAASVDVHPDNLGKLFRRYTSKKLGDYICELRVEDAARKLVETDEPVIDIAFATGFESLRTFNRAFLKFKKMTPASYKKKNKPTTTS